MPSKVTTTWRGPAFAGTVFERERRLAKATAKRGEAIAKSNMQRAMGPADTSEPGEYPKIHSNTLFQNIHSELYETSIKSVVARWGVYARYARKTPEDDPTPVGAYAFWLETGTRKMQPRPWLTMSMEELKQEGWVNVNAPVSGGVF